MLAYPDASGNEFDLYTIGTAIFQCLIVTVNLKLATRTRYWTWINHTCVWLSIGLFFPFLYAASGLWSRYSVAEMASLADVAQRLYNSAGEYQSRCCAFGDYVCVRACVRCCPGA